MKGISSDWVRVVNEDVGVGEGVYVRIYTCVAIDKNE